MNFKDSAIVITMVRSPEELSRLGLLIISIRTWGGALARLRIAFFNVNPAQISRKELEDDITESIMMEIPDNLRGYYYGDKVYACARAEELFPEMKTLILLFGFVMLSFIDAIKYPLYKTDQLKANLQRIYDEKMEKWPVPYKTQFVECAGGKAL